MKKIINLSVGILFTLFSVLSFATANENSNYSNTNRNSDASITSTILSNYSNDSLLNPFRLNVKTLHGQVQLTGTVDTNTQYEKAVEIAEATQGVKDVNTSTFHVKNSQQPLTDTVITAKIKGKLMKEAVFGDRDINSMDIHVETKDGKVYLRGTVENAAQKSKIISIARSVKGVRSIKNDLTA